jgi:hypothetical protein
MFTPEDFKVPLEKMLKMRVVNDEIDRCENIKELKTQLKETARLVMVYQHLLGKIAQHQIEGELKEWMGEIEGWDS